MAKAYVLNDDLSSVDRVTLESVISAAGLDIEYEVPEDISTIDPEADVGVVALPASPDDITSIDSKVTAFAGAGIRVIGIWLHDETAIGTGVPDAIDKYGSTVDVASADLMKVLQRETEVWEDAGGKTRPTPVTKRNKC